MKRLIGALIIPFILVGCGAEDHDPAPLSTPSLATHSPLPPVKSSPVPQSSPIDKPVLIYVVNKNVDKTWQLQEAVNSWQAAKWTSIQLVNKCPTDWNIPCVTISEVDNLSLDYAGETNFGALPKQMTIHLNRRAQIYGPEKETTVCHEFGHVLGLGHVKNNRKSCMYDANYYRHYPLVATKLDLSLVDQLGAWDQEKMYESSGVDIDARPQPR